MNHEMGILVGRGVGRMAVAAIDSTHGTECGEVCVVGIGMDPLVAMGAFQPLMLIPAMSVDLTKGHARWTERATGQCRAGDLVGLAKMFLEIGTTIWTRGSRVITFFYMTMQCGL
jgi:hypothetical protein